MIYIHNYLYLFSSSDIGLGKRERYILTSTESLPLDAYIIILFPSPYPYLKNIPIASQAVNQRKSP